MEKKERKYEGSGGMVFLGARIPKKIYDFLLGEATGMTVDSGRPVSVTEIVIEALSSYMVAQGRDPGVVNKRIHP